MLFTRPIIVLSFLAIKALSASRLAISNISANTRHDVELSEFLVHLGNYGVGEHMYRLFYMRDDNDNLDLLSQDYKVISIPDANTTQLFYIQEAGVDQSLRNNGDLTFADDISTLVDTLQNAIESSSQFQYVNDGYKHIQQTLRTPSFKVLHQTSSSAVIAIPNDLVPEIDKLLPRFLVPVHISLNFATVPVPPESISRVKKWIDGLEFNADVADVVNSISEDGLSSDIRYLSGEDPNSDIISRHSFTPGARKAAEWIKAHFEESGLRCELQSFMTGFSPNVICGYSPLPRVSPTVVLGAHYDSRGSFGSLHAPGADDDGSGTIALLEIARTIKNKGVKFTDANVIFATFAGEEQGSLGSHAFAKSLREQNVDVAMMIQADMLGYHRSDEPAQLGYTPAVGTIEVAHLIQNISALYSPELTVGPTMACCSDHQSFHQEGFPAMQLFERTGPIIDPMYHNSGDLSDCEGYDIIQIKSIAKVDLAVTLHAAGFIINK